MRSWKLNIGSQKGQTVIETIGMIFFLLILFFMIAEFARAWYLKNSLNNAARVGVRVAIVTSNLTGFSNTCSAGGTGDPFDATCSASGVPESANVALTIEDDNSDGKATQGEKVTVTVTADFATVVPNILPFMPTSVTAAASMRYEL